MIPLIFGVAGAAASPSPIAFVQSAQASADAGANPTVTYAAPAEGNLMAIGAYVGQDVGSGAVNITTPAGWTAGVTEFDQSGGNQATALQIFYKIAGASEGTSTQVVHDGDGGSSCILEFIEFSGINGTPLDVVQTNGRNDSTANTISTGTTAATAQAKEVAIAFCGLADDDATGATWKNSFTGQEFRVQAGSETGVPGDISAALAYKILSATGTQETTATFTAAGNDEASGGIVTFKGS